MTVRALVLDGHGLNCAREMALGFQLLGAEVKICHLNDLHRLDMLQYQVLVLPGGFSFGDHLGSGRALAQRLLRAPLAEPVARFVAAGHLVWGVCNGFQALVQMGLLPGAQGQATLAPNERGNFECRWVSLRVNPDSPCLWTKDLTDLELPVRHGEGRLLGSFPASQVPLSYAGSDYPDNPNGSPAGQAALCDSSGRIFGLMPHPEAFVRFNQHPQWTRQAQVLLRQGLPVPRQGRGLALFENCLKAAAQLTPANR